MADERRAKRHVYLPGLSAFDKSHRRAAVSEMHFAGDHGEFDPGNIFVDTAEARAAVRGAFEARIDEARTAGGARLAEIPRYEHARDSVMLSQGMGSGENHQAGPADILFVKGHGNPRNPNSIVTTTAPVDHTERHGPGIFEQSTSVRIKRGFKARHSADEIAESISGIASRVDSPGLDVRITSCGSAGTYSRDEHEPAYDPRESFAGRVSGALDRMFVDRRVKVSGYRGDTNSTFPAAAPAAGDGFSTKIKERDASIGTPAIFDRAMTRGGTAVGAPFTAGTQRIKKPLRDLGVATDLKAAYPAPAAPATSARLAGRMKAYTKIVTTTAAETRRVGSTPRASARVTVPRGELGD